ncbi:MAG: divalent-cation tolerance protein CutA [Planctomycetota bacterium]|jgi:periplasmic divalent cation tolerance protein|nr:divalent-cation tolerance protein CutA [Planctomycetota bacterium]MDP6761573.1 divalent-cation tolerance protein CutA [Planctomycetota bacterium]MDP6990973.1 divalent-cation tolerance protein CutA [Planctomycetota bacterium]
MSDAPHSDAAAVRVVLGTAPDEEEGRRLARALVEGGLAACVNLVPGITSVYRWEGAVEESPEVLMVIKTRAERLGDVEQFLEREHPYDVPECVALVPGEVGQAYLSWLLEA